MLFASVVCIGNLLRYCFLWGLSHYCSDVIVITRSSDFTLIITFKQVNMLNLAAGSVGSGFAMMQMLT